MRIAKTGEEHAMIDQFAFSGFSASNMIPCVIDGGDIYQVDYVGNRQLIGKTAAAYSELEQTTAEYYDKLVELGVIVPQKSQEQLMAEMQQSMLDMSGIIKSLSDELKELKANGYKQCSDNNIKDVSECEHKRGSTKGGGGNKADPEQP